MTQVLINLVGNAIKFTDAGEVAIKAEANNGAFYVSVRDTGPGISAADQAKLFRVFQQANNAITRKKGGTGLGARHIEAHHRDARPTQHWVPWTDRPNASAAITEAKALGTWVVAAEQTTASVRPDQLIPKFPACLVLGGERSGVSPDVLRMADAAVAIPMLGMANSLNVATAAAILLYWVSRHFEEAAV